MNATNSKKLIEAANSGNTAEVTKLIEAGANINLKDNTGATPLFRASSNGHLDTIKVLISWGADIDIQDNDGLTPIWTAIENGRIDVVKYLILARADIDIPDNYGVTPLLVASENGFSDIVLELLKYERNMNIQREMNDGNIETDINHQNNKGETALFLASEAGHIDIIRMLIMADADVNIASKSGLTPLFIASWHGNLDIVKDLLIAGADVNSKGNSNETPISTATYTGNIDIVRMLIEAGADVNIADVNGVTPLFLASQEGHTEVVGVLIEAGADVNIADVNGVTPLLTASEQGSINIVRLLLKVGADVYAKNKNGETALELATDSEIIEAIKEKMEGPQEVWKGFTKSDIEKFDIIFGEGAENYSVCPICLEYVERSEACMYMTHDCSKGGGYYYKGLYNKYKTSEGYISWCTICNRIAKGHHHYKLGNAETENPTVLILNSDPFEKDCSKTNGGGGLTEKLARFRRFREYALELQDDIDKKGKRDALNELVEELWNAPLRREKKLLKGITESKKWNIPSAKFTAPTPAPENSAPAPNIPFAGKLPTKINSGRNNVMMNDNIPVIQFHHTQQDGSEETHGIAEETLIDFIKTKNTEFGTPDFGYCFMYPGSCDSRLHPEEVKEHIPKELYDDYKKHFNTKFKGQIGGSNENILQEATDAVCVIVKKNQKGGKRAKRVTRKGRKMGRKMTRRK
jgi:ankyrin repeat protein